MRKTTINIILAFAFGALLAVVGFPLTTWQYWILESLYMATMANSLIESR